MTKLVVTIKSTTTPDEIKRMLSTGLSCFRLNCAHLTRDQIGSTSSMIREACTSTGVTPKLFMDLPGIKSRIWYKPSERITIKTNDRFTIRRTNQPTSYNGCFHITGDNFFFNIRDNDVLQVRRRENVRLQVVECNRNEMQVVSLGEGQIGWGYYIIAENKYIPSIDLEESDKELLPIVLRAEPDFIGASFADTPEMIRSLKANIQSLNTNTSYRPGILAKIESPIAVSNVSEILKECDGAIIGRDDLSTWLTGNLNEATYQVISACKQQNKLSVPASNYYSSLCTSDDLSEENRKDIMDVLAYRPNYLYCNETHKTDCWENVVRYSLELGMAL